ncbi:MAG TPA: hypothetical protein VHP83_10405 [Aggregatilineaceae bacterium]|nr:hypothetical protein [Aggregatilineaceae bacterium]
MNRLFALSPAWQEWAPNQQYTVRGFGGTAEPEIAAGEPPLGCRCRVKLSNRYSGVSVELFFVGELPPTAWTTKVFAQLNTKLRVISRN